ncbi:uncharacterized protein AB675_958 [Cyphellophora attinorum]|uniref:Uncharacterized protein n=1 Tax=Cyphellophora attinorum TaxID=1664694 RepID=A0A0N1HBE4_9EURO|nr:uncharacterized protein AB675_958 [Phialophora attinorum]KPI45884.1 hypothetical protein AB675_958 [Phialophora attinorum]
MQPWINSLRSHFAVTASTDEQTARPWTPIKAPSRKDQLWAPQAPDNRVGRMQLEIDWLRSQLPVAASTNEQMDLPLANLEEHALDAPKKYVPSLPVTSLIVHDQNAPKEDAPSLPK